MSIQRPVRPAWREPELHRKRDGWLLIRSDGDSHFLEPLSFQVARVAFAGATVKAFLAYTLFMVVGFFGDGVGLWGWLLPSVGDWAYRDDGGRLSSLARFIDAGKDRA